MLQRLLIRRNYRREVRRKLKKRTEEKCHDYHHLDHQKLDREARICRQLKHPNIGN